MTTNGYDFEGSDENILKLTVLIGKDPDAGKD